MKKLWIFVLVISFLFAGCEKKTVEEIEPVTKNAQISDSDAFEILKDYLESSSIQSLNLENTSLVERTTNEIFEKTGCSIFEVKSWDIPGLNGNYFIVKSNRRGFLISHSDLNVDFKSFICADIKENRDWRIMFLSLKESGGVTSVWFNSIDQLDDSDFFGMSGNSCNISNRAWNYLSLEKKSDQDIQLRYSDGVINLIVAKVAVSNGSHSNFNGVEKTVYELRVFEDLSQEIKEKLSAN